MKFLRAFYMTTTSENLDVIQYDVVTLLEQAGRRCGKTGGTISAEDAIAVKLELAMILNMMVNRGVPLWTVDKQIYGLLPNQNLLKFSADTVDLQNVLYRFNNLPSGGVASSSDGGIADYAFDQNLNTACVQTAPDGNISYNFLTETVVVTVGILPNTTGTLNPVYEYSADGITWFTAIAAASEASIFTKGQWYWQDVEFPQSGYYFRVRETSGGTLDMTEVAFGTSANEIVLSRINKDDYQNLPYKNSTGRPLQFWYDRQIIPQAWVWPASQYAFNTVVVWRRRNIMNTGTYLNSLEFPNRFLDYIIAALALRYIKVVPGCDMQRLPILQADLTQAETLAWDEERDNSPMYLSVNLGGYTGGSRGRY